MKTRGYVIMVAQQKGGAGKTTLAIHLAIALSQKRNKVAIIDVDTQGSLKNWYNIRAERFGEDYTDIKALVSEISSILNITKKPNKAAA